MNCTRCHAAIPADGPGGLCPKCLISVALGEPEVVLTASGEPAPPPPTPEELQPHFPQYEIVRLVGRGGMGAVYEARQKGLGRSVALKVLSAPARADASFEERFVREAQALARLSHENIVAVHDAGRAGPHFFLAMEYVDGPNLRQAERAGRIAPAEALALVTQICAALDYAHKQGVVHRDIKPENVLLSRDGRVKIVDFGLAKVLDRAVRGPSLTRMSQTMGTPHYMAPEQIEHPKDVDHRADIYSLGVVFYELLTGELPLGRFPLPSQKVQIDVRLDDIVIRTLEKEPDRRYQAAGDVRTAVQDVASSPLQSVAAPSEPPKARKPRPVLRILVGALVVVLLLGAAAFAAVLLSGPRVATPEFLRAAEMAHREGQFRMREMVIAALAHLPDPAAPDARAQVLRELAPAAANEPMGLNGEIVRAALELVVPESGQDPLRRFEQHVAASATKLALRGATEVAAVRIEPDGALVRKLRDELAAELRNAVRGYDLTATYIGRIVQEHMPFEYGQIEIRIQRGGGGWVVETRTPEFGRTEPFEDDLPRRYRVLADLFQSRDPAPSAVVQDPVAERADLGAKVESFLALQQQTRDALDKLDAFATDRETRREESLPDVLKSLAAALPETQDPRDLLQALDIALALPNLGLRTNVLARYRAHEAERTTMLPLAGDGEIAAARIDVDPIVVGNLRDMVWQSLVIAFGSRITPEHAQWLAREHVPLVTGPVEIRIRYEPDADRYTVEERVPGPDVDVDRFDQDLPRGLQRIVDRFRRNAGTADAEPAELPDFSKFAPVVSAPRRADGRLARTPSSPAVWAAARGVLAHTGREIVAEYLRVEANHVNKLAAGDDEVARMRVLEFPAVRALLAIALWQQIAENLEPDDVGILRADGFEFVVLPFGDGEYRVSIGGDETGWKCTSERTGGGSVSSLAFPDVPEPYARLLALHRSRR